MTDSTDNARGPELKPCPFCGDRIESFAGIKPEAFAKGCEDFAVQCDCGCIGPFMYTMDGAVAAWNRRADLAPDQLGDPRVWELVEAVEDGIKAGLLPKTSASEGGAAKYSAQVRAADRLRSALAALSLTGGNADG